MSRRSRRKKLSHPFKEEAEKEAAAAEQAAPEAEAAPAPWLTMELGLYGLILLVGLGLRLWHLGAYPLSNVEAEQSLAALALYRGQMPPSDTYNPLLLSLNALAFLLFHPTGISARLGAALLGSGLVGLPLLLRRQVGTRTTLLASALLALSPTAIYLSRTLNAEIAVAAGSMLLVGGFFNWTETGRQPWLLATAGGLALLLLAGPMAYSVLLILGLVVLIRWPAFRARWAAAEPSRFRLTQAAIFLAIIVAVVATTASFNLAGLRPVIASVGHWLNRFGFQARPEAGFNAVFLLTIYEPLLVLAGLTGLAYAIIRNRLVDIVLAGWLVGLLVLDAFMGGRPNSSVILPLVPLAFLAAAALTRLWSSVQQEGSWQNEGILLAAGLVIAVFSYLGLAGWLVRICPEDDRLCQYGWLQPLTALLLFLIIVLFFGFMGQSRAALRGLALTGVVVGLLLSLNIGWRLNYGPLRYLAYQPLAGIPASTGLVEMKHTLDEQAYMKAGDAHLLDTTVVEPISPALRWQLRDYDHLERTNSLLEPTFSTAIISMASAGQELPPNQAYVGQDFTLDAVWSPVGLQPKALLDWFIFRQIQAEPEGNKAILWLRFEES